MAGFLCPERLTFGPWQALERAVARLLAHAGFEDVAIVGGTGDEGGDVVATKGGARWVVQCKFRYSGGADAAGGREVVRAMSSYNATVAVVATNSYFTEDAYRFAASSKSNGIDIRLWDGGFLLKFFDALPSVHRFRRDLRSYQVSAVDAIEERRGLGKRSALIIMATGLGKSLVASEIIIRELERNPAQEVLVLAHTTDLVRQLDVSSWPQLLKNHATHVWTDGEVPAFHGGVVFATWQSIYAAKRRGAELAGRFGLVIIDEAHHAPAASYLELLGELRPNFLVGLTATPWRGDGKSLTEVFDAPAFTMDIIDGMQRGFLAAVDYRMLSDGIDWVEVARLSRNGLSVRDLNLLLIMPDRDFAMVDMISMKLGEVRPRRALGFCRAIDHAERLAPMFAAKGIRTALLHSNLTRQERFANLSAFRAGSLDLLLSVEMLNEGIDIPDVNVIAFMRVTHSRRIFVQQLGRGLRLSENKKSVLVLDFVADIRRVAAGLRLNMEAERRARGKEVVRFLDGRVVKFDNDQPVSFFREYLADIADVEDLDDASRLRFPDTSSE